MEWHETKVSNEFRAELEGISAREAFRGLCWHEAGEFLTTDQVGLAQGGSQASRWWSDQSSPWQSPRPLPDLREGTRKDLF